jgi:hypothetical protein
MTSIGGDVLADAIETYRKMPLLELLREENVMAKLMHAGKFDNMLKRLHAILRSEVEKKLR